jgi:hypothetical protein
VPGDPTLGRLPDAGHELLLRRRRLQLPDDREHELVLRRQRLLSAAHHCSDKRYLVPGAMFDATRT